METSVTRPIMRGRVAISKTNQAADSTLSLGPSKSLEKRSIYAGFKTFCLLKKGLKTSVFSPFGVILV